MTEPETHAGLEMRLFKSRDHFWSWLELHAGRQHGLWLKFARRGSGRTSLTYQEALDAALCFGWIDGHRKVHDDAYFIQRFTPRRRNSNWSAVNISKVETLIGSGRIQSRGYAEIAAAKADGRWQRALERPVASSDFLEALSANSGATIFFQNLTRVQQDAFLRHIVSAKQPETRRRRIGRSVELLANGRKLY